MMESVMVPLAPQNVVMSALRKSPFPNRRFSSLTHMVEIHGEHPQIAWPEALRR